MINIVINILISFLFSKNKERSSVIKESWPLFLEKADTTDKAAVYQ